MIEALTQQPFSKGLTMDFSSIGAAASAITAARELGKAVIGIRDFNKIAVTISQLNDKLLKAQDSLFTHNALLLQIQNEHFKACEELRELKKTITERGRYTLFDLGGGSFVYRMNISPDDRNVGDPLSSEPMHDVCQPCFDKGIKIVLQAGYFCGVTHLECSQCKNRYGLSDSTK